MSNTIDVAVTKLPDGLLQVFAVDGSHAVKTCWKVDLQPGADWTAWEPFPGLTRRITSGSLPGGVPQLFAIGVNDRNLYTCWKVSEQSGANWTDWSLFPGVTDVTDVAAVQLPQGFLQLFVIGADGNLWTCWKVSNQLGADWTPWNVFPNTGHVRRITSGSLPGSIPQLWAIGANARLYTCWKVSEQPGADWTGWGLMPGAPQSVLDVAAVQLPQGFLQLFAVDSTHAIHTCWKVSNQTGADWSEWVAFPGSVRRITSGNLPHDVPQLFGIGTDDQLYSCWKVSEQLNVEWTNWSAFDAGHGMPSTPTITSWALSALSAGKVDFNGGTVLVRQDGYWQFYGSLHDNSTWYGDNYVVGFTIGDTGRYFAHGGSLGAKFSGPAVNATFDVHGVDPWIQQNWDLVVSSQIHYKLHVEGNPAALLSKFLDFVKEYGPKAAALIASA
jgi:hypothetical protein